jgi:hypothetical protein
MKNTLEFDPEILKRYVNFMNNPDERTAVDQFGKGDKYFGVCTLMITLPGLPMFGHGQIEGYTEKYGMEYRRAYWDEQPDAALISRHEREIVPLLQRRYLFAGVENFLLYDFVGANDVINEDVFAYSNRADGERALVVIHNAPSVARGWIKTSVPFSVKTGEGDERNMLQSSLGEGLAVSSEDEVFTIFRDHATGLEYIRPNAELVERGLYLELGAYKTHVFLDFREVRDNEWQQYGSLVQYLKGQGVPSINVALRETFLQPIHIPYRELVNADLFRRIMAQQSNPQSSVGSTNRADDQAREALLDEVEQKALNLAQQIKDYTQGTGDEVALAKEIRIRLDTLLSVDTPQVRSLLLEAPDYVAAMDAVRSGTDGLSLGSGQPEWIMGVLLAWLFTHPLGKLSTDADFAEQSRSWVDEWLLRKIIASTLQELGADEVDAARGVLLVNALISQQGCLSEFVGEPKPAYRVVEAWLKDSDARNFLQVNRHQDLLWYNKESFDRLLGLQLLITLLDLASRPGRELGDLAQEIMGYDAIARNLRLAQAESEYGVEKLLAATRDDTPAQTP